MVLIAGDPDNEAEFIFLQDEAKYRKQLKRFVGEIPTNELQVLWAAAEVAIVPYVRATTSRAVLMAVSFACPILGADHNCVGEMIHPEGGVYSPNDPLGLEDAIVKMKSLHKTSFHRMGPFNFEYTSTLSREKHANRIAEIYRQLFT